MWDLHGSFGNSFYSVDEIFKVNKGLVNGHDKLNEFYDSYMGSSNASGKERATWQVFHDNHVSFDTELPVASITKVSNTEYKISFEDNVCVEYWEFTDGNHTIYDSPKAKNGTHIITLLSQPLPGTEFTLRVYDPQGLALNMLPDGRTEKCLKIKYVVS